MLVGAGFMSCSTSSGDWAPHAVINTRPAMYTAHSLGMTSYFGQTVAPLAGARQPDACTSLTADTGRWRCGPPVRLPRGRQAGAKQRDKEGRDREQRTVRQTEIHGYSNFGVLSQSYWKTVHSELSAEIRYWSLHLLPPPPPSPPLPPQLWDRTFSLLVIPSLSFSPTLSRSYSLPLLGISSIGILVI